MDKDKAEGAVVLLNSALLRRIVLDKLGVYVYSVIIYRKPEYLLPLNQTVAQGSVTPRLSTCLAACEENTRKCVTQTTISKKCITVLYFNVLMAV